MAQRNTTIARYLGARCTQGGADAFVQATIATGIDPADGVGLQIVGLETVFQNDLSAVSADFNVLWSLSRDSQTSTVGLNNPSCIFADGFFGALTTSGQILIPTLRRYEFIDGLFLVEPSVYFQLDSNATGLVNVLDMRIYYQEVALTEVDILRILNNA